VSLNNRVLIRDSYEARGAVVVTGCGSGSSPGSTTDAINLEHEKPQNDCMNEPIADAQIEKGESEFCDGHIIVSLSHASSSSGDHRHCVRWTLGIGGVIC
jgi:hypothetical protein